MITGFPGGSAGKESACNAGDEDSIRGPERSLENRQVTHSSILGLPGVSDDEKKNLPAMRETWVQSLGWEDPLEKGTASHSSILAWRIPWTEEPDELQSSWGHRVRHD